MPNHPNRSWRRHASVQAESWLARWPWRTEPGGRILTEAQVRDLMRTAYLAGYEARHTRDHDRQPTV